jgi:hypothetical protein
VIVEAITVEAKPPLTSSKVVQKATDAKGQAQTAKEKQEGNAQSHQASSERSEGRNDPRTEPCDAEEEAPTLRHKVYLQSPVGLAEEKTSAGGGIYFVISVKRQALFKEGKKT